MNVKLVVRTDEHGQDVLVRVEDGAGRELVPTRAREGGFEVCVIDAETPVVPEPTYQQVAAWARAEQAWIAEALGQAYPFTQPQQAVQQVVQQVAA